MNHHQTVTFEHRTHVRVASDWSFWVIGVTGQTPRTPRTQWCYLFSRSLGLGILAACYLTHHSYRAFFAFCCQRAIAIGYKCGISADDNSEGVSIKACTYKYTQMGKNGWKEPWILCTEESICYWRHAQMKAYMTRSGRDLWGLPRSFTLEVLLKFKGKQTNFCSCSLWKIIKRRPRVVVRPPNTHRRHPRRFPMPQTR